ncbi:caspase domain-containing protein [Boletus edulis BED1]|uniref:Caspase domain-containing protein n=1 Tax=Boletus edulis BED1 TaxID=1328754 RepID=A0AAD4BP70_BOLED|nr:caspase domain-containing protein [Boletus edulis BED1]
MARGVVRPSVPLFALVIGIDNYAHCGKLHGAVRDAKAIKQYLEEELGVSEDRIYTLFDEEATRHAIIKAFRNLQNDQRINKGDPIMIFYSGHGGETNPPHSWGLDRKIQCLLPQDCEIGRANLPTDCGPIPDRTIGALIEDIARAKGDNITVIFDCCHSASGTRRQDAEYIPRSVDLHCNIPETLDDYIWGSRHGKMAHGFAYHGLRSHVLLAACGETELAYEHGGRGLFTSALLATLKSCAVNDLTYAGLLDRIQLRRQHPQCEGFNRHRVLFNSRLSGGRQVCHPVQTDRGGKYVVSAGLAHGVSPGVEFTLYNDRKLRLGAVLVDEASTIDDFETTIITSVPLGSVSFAKLTRVREVPVHLGPREHLSSTLKNLLRGDSYGTDTQKFRMVEAEEAKLGIAMEGDEVVFKVLDERVKRFGLTELPHKATLDGVARVLNSAAHYYWFLDLAQGHDQISTKHEVAVDFYRLKVEYDDYGESLLAPVGPGFCHRDPSADNSDVIDFIVDPDAYYGIKITNNTPLDLYLNAFLFNHSSLSIVPYYTQSNVGAPEAPLKRGGTFTIGYGDGGTPPFAYSLEGNQDVDVGYLKIFFATRPIDLSDIEQSSPFASVHERNGEDDATAGGGLVKVVKSMSGMSLLASELDDTWFTLDIPVVQRRSAVV